MFRESRHRIAFFFMSMNTAFSMLSAAESFNEDPFITVVHPQRKENGKEIDISPKNTSFSNPDERLSDLPEITLTRQGGALTPAELKFRGLSGPRAEVLLDGLDLSDPVSGLVDAQDLPLFAVDRASTDLRLTNSLGSIRFGLPAPRDFFSREFLGQGSFNTGRAHLLSQFAISDSLSFLAGALLGTTSGRFSFLDNNAAQTRENNDHSRLLSIMRLHWHRPSQDISLLTFGRIYKGGLPGLINYPMPNYRIANSFFGGSARVLSRFDDFVLIANFQTRFDVRRAKDSNPSNNTSIDSLAERFEISGTFFPFQKTVEVTTGLTADHVSVLGNNIQRFWGDAYFRFSRGWKSQLRPRLNAQMKIHAYSDLAPAVSGYFDFAIEPISVLDLMFRFSRNIRPPSVAELYAPMGGIKTNPDLKSESSLDAELISAFDWRFLHLKTTLFWSTAFDSIFYMPTSGFEYMPINTGKFQRAGIESLAQVNPFSFLALEWNNKYLFSLIDATGAQLPNTPPFWTRAGMRIDPIEQLSTSCHVRYQSGSTGDLRGVSQTSPYTMLDADLRVTLFPGANVFFELNNILDVQDARDLTQMPLPGRNFFIGVEVAT